MFLDANVLLEILLDRGKGPQARAFLNSQTEKPAISALTAHLVVHFGSQIVDFPVLRHFLNDYTIISLDSADIEWAFINMRGTDFEDALQMAVAIRNGYGTFATFDKNLMRDYEGLPSIRTQLIA